jgi:transposase InsO family protein
MCEGFFHSLQLELLDQHRWRSRRELALAIFQWIETWYNASRRHSSIDMLSPVDYETANRINTVGSVRLVVGRGRAGLTPGCAGLTVRKAA